MQIESSNLSNLTMEALRLSTIFQETEETMSDTVCVVLDIMDKYCDINVIDFPKHKKALKEEFECDDKDAFKAYILRQIYQLGLEESHRLLPFHALSSFDFVRAMMPVVNIYDGGNLSHVKFYNMNLEDSKKVAGWDAFECELERGNIDHSYMAKQYEYSIKDCYSLVYNNMTIRGVENVEKGCEYYITPWYVDEMKRVMENIGKDVLVVGLKTGALVAQLLDTRNVEVTVVEEDESLIEFFKANIMPKFKNRTVNFINAAPVEWLKNQDNLEYSDVLIDLFDELADFEEFDEYYEIKQVEKKFKNINFQYFAEFVILKELLYFAETILRQMTKEWLINEADTFENEDALEDEDDCFINDYNEYDGLEWLERIIKNHKFETENDILKVFSFQGLNKLILSSD